MSGPKSTGQNQGGTRPFTYQDPNKDPNLIINKSEPSCNQRIGDPRYGIGG